MFGKPTRRAHLVALELAGVTLKPGELGLHKCNVKACVRVHELHVYPGTHSQNCLDRKEAGFKPVVPHVPGSLNGEAKLTEEQVILIRKIYEDGRSGRARRPLVTTIELAYKFGISASQVKRIINRQSWKHI